MNIEKPWTEVVQIRGPGNSAFLVEMHHSKDVYEVRFLLKNFILGRHKCEYEESGISEFEKNGFLVTKPLENFNNIRKKAVMHSKAIGAEKVIELKESKQLQFICQPNRMILASNKLSIIGYEIDSIGVTYFPLNMVSLSKKHRTICDKFLRVMDSLPNVVKIYDNIYR